MANGGQWDPISLPKRPGLYINFVERALAQIVGGPRGVVAVPVFEYTGGTIEAGKFMTIEGEQAANEAVGKANAKAITMALAGGAAEVLIYAVPTPFTDDYTSIRAAFEARPFNVFVYPNEITADEQEAAVAWTARNRKDGKHFTF